MFCTSKMPTVFSTLQVFHPSTIRIKVKGEKNLGFYRIEAPRTLDVNRIHSLTYLKLFIPFYYFFFFFIKLNLL